MLLIYTDGACFGNPGPMGIGVAIYKNEKLVNKISEYIGIGTNNIAEYSAIIRALEIAKNNGENELEIRSDSELVIKQINRKYKIRIPHLKKLKRKIDFISNEINVKFIWIPREQNVIADELSKKAINL